MQVNEFGLIRYSARLKSYVFSKVSMLVSPILLPRSVNIVTLATHFADIVNKLAIAIAVDIVLMVTGQLSEGSFQQSAMQMNRCRHLVPLYPYHTTNYNYYNLITFNCVL